MHTASDPSAQADAIRSAGARALAQALQHSRADTLNLFSLYEQALPELRVPYRDDVNPPLWELGHVGWFQEWWLTRNPQYRLGVQANPDVARRPSVRVGADTLYDSGRVAHATRWTLDLPSSGATREDLAAQLAQTLALLQVHAEDDPASEGGAAALYFFRLALLHEDMHHEAALYMAQTLTLDGFAEALTPAPVAAPKSSVTQAATMYALGQDAAHHAFTFDNESGHAAQALNDYAMDSRVALWGDYLPFVESRGYAELHWWSAPGRDWLTASGAEHPLALRRRGAGWERRFGAHWQPVDLLQPACHLNFFEAQAWCTWAGRRLPLEAEWELAARAHAGVFSWGQVWEWTASPFVSYDGFVAHPYRDYSQPWMDARPVLRGASFATQPRIRHWSYRNFFQAHRRDVPTGFRSCSAAPAFTPTA